MIWVDKASKEMLLQGKSEPGTCTVQNNYELWLFLFYCAEDNNTKTHFSRTLCCLIEPNKKKVIPEQFEENFIGDQRRSSSTQKMNKHHYLFHFWSAEFSCLFSSKSSLRSSSRCKLWILHKGVVDDSLQMNLSKLMNTSLIRYKLFF